MNPMIFNLSPAISVWNEGSGADRAEADAQLARPGEDTWAKSKILNQFLSESTIKFRRGMSWTDGENPTLWNASGEE
jgi:hypothetical protein